MNSTVYIDGKAVQQDAEAPARRRPTRELAPSKRCMRVTLVCGRGLVIEGEEVRRLTPAQADAVIQFVDSLGVQG